MAGELVPLVVLPRYSTYANGSGGSVEFTTIAMDVTEYENVILNVWRQAATASGAVTFNFQESTDQVSWYNCTVTASDGSPGPNFDPGPGNEVRYKSAITKRYFRVKINMGTGGSVVTCWAVGFLESRQS